MIARVWREMMKAGGLRTWAILGAAVVLTASGVWRTWIVWKGPWADSRQEQQLDIIGWALWGDQIAHVIIIIALTGLGVAASVSRTGVNLNVGDDDQPSATVTTTTETTVTAEPKP